MVIFAALCTIILLAVCAARVADAHERAGHWLDVLADMIEGRR